MDSRSSYLPSVPSLIVGLVSVAVLDIGFKYWKMLKSIKYLPGRRELIGVHAVIRALLPRIPCINYPRHEAINESHKPYVKYGRDIISWVAVIPSVEAYIFVADPMAVKEIISNRARFPKNLKAYKSLVYFGSNILATDGEEWKKQRKIVAPSFNEKNNKLVWDESVRLMVELFHAWGKDEASVTLNNCVSELTLPLALFVISSAGFGRRVSWSADETIPQGHNQTFKEALHHTSLNIIKLLYFPKWIIKRFKSLRKAEESAKELTAYLKDMIEEGKNSVDIHKRNDLFGALLAVTLGDDSAGQLSMDELLGNMFIFILAGHETSSHTLCFTLGMLAIEQEEQEKMYQHILSVTPDQENPGYESFGKLSYVMAVINETLRLYPPVVEIPKITNEACLIPSLGPNGSVEHVFVPAGVEVRIDTVGLHHNPRYWPDPMTFDPSRFTGNYNRDAFLPFSGGARACIGRGFAETEMVAALTVLIKNYRVELRDKEDYRGLSKLEQRRKLFPTLQIVTTTPKNPVPLVFKKRI